MPIIGFEIIGNSEDLGVAYNFAKDSNDRLAKNPLMSGTISSYDNGFFVVDMKVLTPPILPL